MARVKHLSLREEDEQLLLHLHDFVYLDKAFIEKHIYTSYKNNLSIYRRLNSLADAGYIKTFQRQIDNKQHRTSNIYTLAKFGVDTVEQLRGIVHWRDSWSHDTPPWWRHQLLIAGSVQRFKDEAERVGLVVHEWITEVRAYYEYPTVHGLKSKTAIRPDGVLVIGKPDSDQRMGIFLEMERSYSTKERTLRKIEQFSEFFSRYEELMEPYQRKVAFDEPITSWTILFIGATETKAKKLLRDLANESAAVPVLVASKEAIDADPYGRIYTDTRSPDELTTL